MAKSSLTNGKHPYCSKHNKTYCDDILCTKRATTSHKLHTKRDPLIETEDGKCPEWVDIIWKGRMVQINGKGQIKKKK
jgi:hypothetical protein